ncbi:MAG: siderophore-interacting protein [Rhodococcus sp. (in: high G+C Gram-positive bacteria)]|jgi:NADPH-dependent ferric siderophore reductase|uniref:siderophore-interacting protein n=1 Tax=Rhodococcus sp. EPR-157 TaxID=1813677 RepID=UPI0007BBDD98|nr:siderophore-interacting protein [Rhodococcus sp. EPR-157]KZF03969.1 NADPH-dependent ferric siderophore reductase [Rhodococcus sp. EPR-157]
MTDSVVPRTFDAVTVSTVFVTPAMIRVRFGGAGLGKFESTGVPDERLRLLFGDGAEQVARSYTVRAFDPRGPFLDVDFVVHDGGIAADWALRAKPGDRLELSEARGWYGPPSDSGWQLLVADMTGLPALTRVIEQLPADSRAFVIATVPDGGDEQTVATQGKVSYQWLHTCLPERGKTSSTATPSLPQAVRSFSLPDGPGHVWVATEASEARSIRKYFHRELSWDPTRFQIKGYWRRDKERWQQRYAQVHDRIDAVREQAIADGKFGDELARIVDNALEQAGL